MPSRARQEPLIVPRILEDHALLVTTVEHVIERIGLPVN